MIRKLLAGIVLLVVCTPVVAQSITVAEDAESGDTNNWQVLDDPSTGYEVSSKSEGQNRFISFSGVTRQKGFLLGNTSSAAPGLDLIESTSASFRLRATAGFLVSIIVDTDNGVRYLRYSQAQNTTPRGTSRVVSVGLGRQSYNGYWQSYSRDLQADLAQAQPGNNILAIQGVQVQGAIDLDDVVFFNASIDNAAPVAVAGSDQQVIPGQAIKLDGTQSSDTEGPIELWRWTDAKNNLLGNTSALSLPADWVGQRELTLTVSDTSGASSSNTIAVTVLPPAGLSTVVEDAEQGDTSKWRVADKTPAGYGIENVEEDGNRFISMTGTDRKNAFIIGNRTATDAALGIENSSKVSWRMRTDNDFIILFALDTTDGFRYVSYTSSRLSQVAGSERSLRAGLGSLAKDDTWHLFNRDLQADLQQMQPNNSIVSVNGAIVRGTVALDDLIFYGDAGETPTPLDPPTAPVLSSPDETQRVQPGTTLEFAWQTVDNASTYRFELSLSSQGFDEILASSTLEASTCSNTACTLEVDLPDDDTGIYTWQVKAINDDGESEWSARSFEPEPVTRPLKPVNISPEVGVDINEGATVEFVWQYDANVAFYDFHLFNRNTSEAVDFTYGMLPADICDAELCRFTADVNLPIGNNHAWRVRPNNAAGTSDWSRSIFNMVKIVTDPPQEPVLASPVTQATLEIGSSPEFSWQKSEAASSYALRILSAGAPEESLIDVSLAQSACDQTTCSVSVNLDLPAANDYLWQVTASNAAGPSATTERGFMLVAAPLQRPATPVNVSPVPAANIVEGSEVEFIWEQDPDATTYEFHIFDNVAKNTTPYVVGLLASEICSDGQCSLTQTVTQPISTYHAWRVRGRNSLGPSSWSRSIFTVVETAVDPDPDPDPTNRPPVAAFSIAGFDETVTGSAPLTVTMDPASSTDDQTVVAYRWTFGDGTEILELAEATIVEHTYTEPGDYTLELEVSDAQGLTDIAQRQVSVVAIVPPVTDLSAVDAARLLTQATFGPTRSEIDQVRTLGIEAWIDRQFTLKGDSHLAYVQQYSNGSGRGPRHEIWWKSAVDGDDQLRLRVAFALSQLFVVSDTGYTLANAQYGITSYYQMLIDNAFGSYRELLEDVTLHPVMGVFLSVLQNGKGNTELSTRPDENYAREVLQLFTIGLYNLNADGTTNGSPAFNQSEVEAFSRIFTGWNYADAGRWDRPLFTNADMISSMEPFEDYHDTSQKVLLDGEVVPAGLSARADLDRALDNIFNHPNVGPFVASQLIKRLVTSNPSRQYVADVTATFNNDGTGMRGNLKAVVKTILMHEEARTIPGFAAYGKLREPVLRLSHLWRAFGVLPGSNSSARNEYNTSSPQLMNLEAVTGQAPLKSPSVFNFFQPTFAPAGPIADQNLQAPEFELFTEGNELATTNRIGQQINRYSVSSISDGEKGNSYVDFSFEVELAGDVNALLAHLDVLLLSGGMSEGLRNVLSEHLLALPETSAGHLTRVRDAVTLIMASPDYLVQM